MKTKIVATLGPVSSSRDVICEMITEGVDVFRINFSHGSFDNYALMLSELKAARQAVNTRVTAVMGDLCGPKIRTGIIQPAGDMLYHGDEVAIAADDDAGNAKRFGTNYEFFVKDVQVGDRVFIDDGQISMLVISKDDSRVVCKVIAGGPLYSCKGINLPDTQVSIPSITERDWKCVDWAIDNGIDFLALSFVRSAEDVIKLRDYIQQKDSHIKIVSKIETPQGVGDLDNIVDAADAVLIARGDLGVEMDLAEVPLIQKRITRMCADKGKPVIVATQMLQSMIDKASPTRAEVSDVANAIMDMTDAVMLSGETAVGKYPLDAVRTMGRIASVTEAFLDSLDEPRTVIEAAGHMRVISGLARSVAHIVDEIDIKVVAIWSEDGRSACFFSKSRIDAEILAFSSNELTCRQMSMHYGILPRMRQIPESVEVFTGIVEKEAVDARLARTGDKILIVSGRPVGATGTTDSIIIHMVNAND